MDFLAVIALILIGVMVATLPIYLAARVVSKKATFGRAFLAAFLGPLVFFGVLFLAGSVTLIVFAFLLPLAFLVALVFLIYFYAAIFGTSFLGGFAIAIIAVLISFIIMVLLSALSFFAIAFSGGRRFGLSVLLMTLGAYLPASGTLQSLLLLIP